MRVIDFGWLDRPNLLHPLLRGLEHLGLRAANGRTLPFDVRWTGVLQQTLGPRYRVIEEGLNARTTVWEDPIMPGRNGKKVPSPVPRDPPAFRRGGPIPRHQRPEEALLGVTADIARGVGVLIGMIDNNAYGPNGQPPKVLVLPPPLVGKLTDYEEMFEGATKIPEAVDRICETAVRPARVPRHHTAGRHQRSRRHSSRAGGSCGVGARGSGPDHRYAAPEDGLSPSV